MHLNWLRNSFKLQIESKNYRKNFQHFQFKAIILSFQKVSVYLLFLWLPGQRTYLQNTIILFFFFLQKREMSQKMQSNKHTHITDICIYLHAKRAFLDKNSNHLNIWQSHRQNPIQKQWRLVENRAVLWGILQRGQPVSGKDSLNSQEKQRCLVYQS